MNHLMNNLKSWMTKVAMPKINNSTFSYEGKTRRRGGRQWEQYRSHEWILKTKMRRVKFKKYFVVMNKLRNR